MKGTPLNQQLITLIGEKSSSIRSQNLLAQFYLSGVQSMPRF